MTDAESGGYCCTTPRALCFWFAAFLVFYGSALLLEQIWPAVDDYHTALLLAAIGLACLANFGWNRIYHCSITGPLFLGAAAVLALNEAGTWQVPDSLIWGVVLIGSGLAFLLERRYGT